MAKFSLYLGKDKTNGEYVLCITNQDTGDIYPVATFHDELRMQLFTEFMETQGYLALKLPTEDELNKFFEGE